MIAARSIKTWCGKVVRGVDWHGESGLGEAR